MGNSRSTKRAIELARLEKAAAKRERRQARPPVETGPTDESIETRESQADVLAALAALHESFARGTLQFADFEAERNDLMRRVRVD
jgi:hypothetical protein